MVGIECLACRKTVKLPKYIDPEKYDGQVVCQECKSLLHVKLAKGKVQKYKIEKNKSEDFDFTKLVIRLAEERKQQRKEEEG